ncbi:hypothetical protein N7526_001403 [Penicillium atrosanguineum]|nr:hypothetical protein N7526_001403 [Penicillium atrosanguineum]
MAKRVGASDLTSSDTHPIYPNPQAPQDMTSAAAPVTHSLASQPRRKVFGKANTQGSTDSEESLMGVDRARSTQEAPVQQGPSALREVIGEENRDLETHSAEHEHQLEQIDLSINNSSDGAGVKGPATPSKSHVLVHTVMRDPSVTNNAVESISPSQSSEAAEDDEDDQNTVDTREKWEFAIVDKDDNPNSESSSYDYAVSHKGHTPVHRISFRHGPPGNIYDEFHDKEIPRNNDRANTYSSRLNDAHARKFGYPANDGLWPQVPASRYHHSTPDFIRSACFRRCSFPPISSFPAWDQAEDEDIRVEEVPLCDLLHRRYSDIELFQNERTWSLLPKADDYPAVYERADGSLFYYPSKTSAVHPRRASDPDVLDLENPSKTRTEVHLKRAPDPDIFDFENPSRTPTEAFPGRWTGPGILELRICQRFQYSSTVPTDEMPGPHVLPDMNETPELIRHTRYQACPGKCHHNSVLRYWINEDAPERVCDICGGTARFLWSCTADTPDWTDASPRTVGPAPAAPTLSKSVPNVPSFPGSAANESAPPALPTNVFNLSGFSPISSAPPGLAGNVPSPSEFSFFNPAASESALISSSPNALALTGYTPLRPTSTGPASTGPASIGPAATSSDTDITGPDISTLAEWMQKAITIGEYTPAQVQKLANQKLQVLECAARDRAAQAERAAKAAYAARPPTTGEGTTVRAWLARQTDRESHQGGDIQEGPWNGGPCRAIFCPLCHWEFTERSLGHIDQVVNEPYVAPPNIPEYLNRPISDAAVLRAMRPMHWVRGREFGLWWLENRYLSGRDMAPVLRHALNGGWTEEQFKLTSWWVYWQHLSDLEVGARVRWLKARNLEQISSFSQSITDLRFIVSRSSERQCSSMRMGLDPVLSISRHPIWEEYESQGRLVVCPGWEYSLGHRWQALSRPEHKELTRLVTEQQDALAIQGVSSAALRQSVSPSQGLTQETEVPQQAGHDFDSLYDASDRE